ncbi:hypothetical protein BIY24_04760 [Halobacteriovorax marinus]|uniref:Polysaccharide deacetylase family protein n=1 Tax=Halobacteriovorax marinus (strain ATCC BAA-682 / DSM 15412 / SJ) TaxID=862908 RepID=E1WXT7_HALMS|nr:polysaccharide deacetylase family protein [Halobacteriovorax marinus]ATH07269.1 hypothetical protein BIY24_04760 [Halobacteriovorax marinus]CBW25894.1 putative polysaccharide deacetylase family protein [Halobacteriovorax marinus SJ]
MIKPILAAASLVLTVNTMAAVEKQFPENNYVYRPKVDTGFEQYRTKSLRNSNKVVLTFDDGPHNTRTPKLLDMLKRENVKATFFILTKNVNASNMYIIERILKEGHILASHDHDHDNNNGESEQVFRDELYDTVSMIESLKRKYNSNQISSFYRFPYGAYGQNKFYHHFNIMKDVSDRIYGENCINFAFWDIDSADWLVQLSPKQIAQNVLAHVVGGTAYRHKVRRTIFGNTKYEIKKYKINHPIGGGVALLHDIHERSIEAAEIFIKEAKKQNIDIVPLDEVDEFSYRNKSCQSLL